ncbi:MAG: hypothetical protein JJT95_04565 [Pararhodobacter sp.]|nr:hypothetical protein [Pararhodobacter sp.]
MASGRESGQVRRRRVFYLPGFDPAVPRRYRELYRREGMRQAAISGYELEIEPPHAGQKGYGWGVWLRDGQVESRAHVSVLVWHDIVLRAMRHGPLGIHALLWRTHWIFVSTGAMAALWRLRPGPMLASVYVTLVMLAQMAMAIGLAGALWWGLAAVLSPLAGLWAHAAGALAGAAVAYALLVVFRRRDSALMAHYMLQDFAHSVAHRGAWADDMEARIDEFAAEIRAALAGDWDEVLVVAHSSGCAVAVAALARALRMGTPREAPPLALMTLGQLIPLQGFMPRAKGFRRDLHDLAANARLFWLDVTARGDGACFWLSDPVAVCGAAPARQHNPLVISAAFSRALRPETWKRLRRRFYKLHFQYLSAFDNPQDYDYFRITAGAMTLRERFGGRANSPQCERREFAPARARGMA